MTNEPAVLANRKMLRGAAAELVDVPTAIRATAEPSRPAVLRVRFAPSLNARAADRRSAACVLRSAEGDEVA